MGYVAAQILKRAIERNNKKSCCCCNCRKENKPKRYEVRALPTGYAVYDTSNAQHEAFSIPTREAAERIAAIYEEVIS